MIRQLVPEEVCLECKGCCRFHEADSVWVPGVLAEDVQLFLKNKIPPFFILANKKLRLTWDKKQQCFLCGFFDAPANRCNVYAVRPFECQLYPFVINRRSKKAYLALDTQCPYAAQHEKSALFKEYLRYLSDFFQTPQVIALLKANPHVIQEYPDAVDLLEIKL